MYVGIQNVRLMVHEFGKEIIFFVIVTSSSNNCASPNIMAPLSSVVVDIFFLLLTSFSYKVTSPFPKALKIYSTSALNVLSCKDKSLIPFQTSLGLVWSLV